MKVEKEFAIVILLLVGVLVLAMIGMMKDDKETKERALSEGRTNICYTQLGDKYWCE